MSLNDPRRIIVLGDMQLAAPIATHLRGIDRSIDTVPNANDALQLWRSGDYALILCLCPDSVDVALQFGSRIREEEAADDHTPIIAALGIDVSHDVALCWQAGIDDTIAMTVDYSSLCEKVEEWLGGERGGDDMVWDSGALTRLIGPSPSAHARLISRFVQSASGQLEALATMSALGDEAGIRDVLHKLKSAARTVGAYQLANLCQDFETLHGLNRPDVASDAFTKLNQAWARVMPVLITYEQPT